MTSFCTFSRPYVKHVIMAYGVDIPTEVGYVYRKKRRGKSATAKQDAKGNRKKLYDGTPILSKVLWETTGGQLEEQVVDTNRGSFAEALIKKKPKLEPVLNGSHLHSGDGTIPYMSLSWAHTWLLHAIRAKRYGKKTASTTMSINNDGNNPDDKSQTSPKDILDTVHVSYRPADELEWKLGHPPVKATIPMNAKRNTSHKKSTGSGGSGSSSGSTSTSSTSPRDDDGDTGTSHPHGTKYKPLMVRFHNVGVSRQTGMEYSTTILEAVGVEHKETTRNYDILAAAFSEILIHMQEDYGLV
jgi:hypothetical protein